MSSDALLPEVDEVSRPFWEGTAAGELRMQACARCRPDGQMLCAPGAFCTTPAPPHPGTGKKWPRSAVEVEDRRLQIWLI